MQQKKEKEERREGEKKRVFGLPYLCPWIFLVVGVRHSDFQGKSQGKGKGGGGEKRREKNSEKNSPTLVPFYGELVVLHTRCDGQRHSRAEGDRERGEGRGEKGEESPGLPSNLTPHNEP